MNFAELMSVISKSSKKPKICYDSRTVEPGDCFVAIKGNKLDGHDFIQNALNNGAKFIISEKPADTESAQNIIVNDSSVALALLAQSAMSNPSMELTNLAVTGTNGKTTVGFLVRSVIHKAGQKCGLIGTIVYDTSIASVNASLTTPDAITIAAMSREMLDAGAEYMMIEASSHALVQKRLAGIEFAAAAFTNLSSEHLDYHDTIDDYLAAKTLLFQNLGPESAAILNKQSPHFEKIAEKTDARVLTYAVNAPAGISADIISMDHNGTRFNITFQKETAQVKTKLIGEYNVKNHLAAAGLCLEAGFNLDEIATGLASLEYVPGRLEPVRCGQDFSVFIDYAHTDDALERVLKTLRPLCKAKIITVFGCGGDRDKTKRPRMAKVAQENSDYIIVTNDNPRTEKPSLIIEDIQKGFTQHCQQKVIVEQDRRKAIKTAIQKAQKDDIVLIAGKGHEIYQIVGDDKFYFSDVEIASEIIASK